MPRIPRNYMKTNFFHVMTQGINKSYIFEKSLEKKKYIKLMYQLKEECNISIIAYAIMDNHSHLLIKCNSIKDMSSYMHKLNTTYAAFYNRLYKRVGYVFRDRYKSEAIVNEIHLYNCIRYIFENPVKARICDRMEQYNYSNYKQFKFKYKLYICSEVRYNSFIDTEEEKDSIYNEVINEFLYTNNINKDKLIKNKEKLKEIVNILHKNYRISSRKMEELLFISRETIRKLIDKE